MSVAVMLSLLEALTLAPMRCSQFLSHGKETAVARWMNRMMDALSAYYHRVLVWCLARRWSVILRRVRDFRSFIVPASRRAQGVRSASRPEQFLTTIYTPAGFVDAAHGRGFSRGGKVSQGSSRSRGLLRRHRRIQRRTREPGQYVRRLEGPPERRFAAPFTHKPTQQEFMAFARENFNKIKGVTRATVLDLSLQGFTAQRGIRSRSRSRGRIGTNSPVYSAQIMDKMKQSGLMTDVDTDYNPNMPELKVIPDRSNAARRGVTVQSIANDVSALVGSFRSPSTPTIPAIATISASSCWTRKTSSRRTSGGSGCATFRARWFRCRMS